MTTPNIRALSFGQRVDDNLASLSVVSRFGTISADTYKEVYRRGARAFASADGVRRTRSAWARANAFNRLLTLGRPDNSAYVSDFDLLPIEHPLTTMRLTASGAAPDLDLTVSIPETNTFATPEDAIITLTEYLGMGYSCEPAIRASWMRAVREGSDTDPYRRARFLAELGYASIDADLLPKSEQ